MDWQTILISFITSCVPALIAYFTATNQGKTKLKELEKSNQADLEKMKLEYELKLQHQESNLQNNLTAKLMTGELDIRKITESVEQVSKLARQAENLSKTKPRKK
ncbi:hypothetical protein [Listeria fleischmannii]|uniref:hypothetical protein n=1 Tax=Listeria fleischmannii TaxID=1069827 RepID=UPI0016253B09|nr:hypothetical protein [Listeria fleischmannii]MBC1420182.1 hypothetical protein [Listeria fleischmannii]